MEHPNYPRTEDATFAWELRPGPTSGLPCLYRLRRHIPGAGWELLLSRISAERAADYGFTAEQHANPAGLPAVQWDCNGPREELEPISVELSPRRRLCQDDSCDLSHCAKCGSHMIGAYLEHGAVCSACQIED